MDFNPRNVAQVDLPRNVAHQLSNVTELRNVAELRFRWKIKPLNVEDLVSNVTEQRNVSQLRFQWNSQIPNVRDQVSNVSEFTALGIPRAAYSTVICLSKRMKSILFTFFDIKFIYQNE